MCIRLLSISLRREKTGGNAEDCESKGLAKNAIRNEMKPKEFQIDGGVTGLQTGCGARVCKLLILLGDFCGAYPPPVFGPKSSDLFDSKGLEFYKSDKEFAIV
jgi:hypothetical protein